MMKIQGEMGTYRIGRGFKMCLQCSPFADYRVAPTSIIIQNLYCKTVKIIAVMVYFAAYVCQKVRILRG